MRSHSKLNPWHSWPLKTRQVFLFKIVKHSGWKVIDHYGLMMTAVSAVGYFLHSLESFRIKLLCSPCHRRLGVTNEQFCFVLQVLVMFDCERSRKKRNSALLTIDIFRSQTLAIFHRFNTIQDVTRPWKSGTKPVDKQIASLKLSVPSMDGHNQTDEINSWAHRWSGFVTWKRLQRKMRRRIFYVLLNKFNVS